MSDRDIDTWLTLDAKEAEDARFADRQRQRQQGFVG